jgi:hypothetical protein
VGFHEEELTMNIRSPLILSASLMASITVANADDHLFNAQQHGLDSGTQASSNTHAFTENEAGHSGNLAPGQGSPFAGEETKTPATDTDAANEHANVKERTPK